MLNSRAFDYRIWVTLAVSLGFGVVINKLIPMLSEKPLYLMAFPVVILVLAVMVIKPKWFLAGMIVARPLLDNILNLTKSGGQGVGLGALLNVAIVVLAVFLGFHYSTFPRRNSVVRSWFIYLFFMFLAACYSPFVMNGLRLYFDYLSYFAMFLIPFLVIKTREDFLYWLKVLALSFVLPVLYANVDMAHGGHYYEDAGKRVVGTFTHPNILAFYLVLGITTYFYILKSKYWHLKPGLKWGIRLMIFNMLLLLIMTKTRNAWMACYLGFFIYGCLKDKKFLIILLLVLPLSLVIPQVQDRILTILQGKESNNYEGMNSMVWRLRMWQSSLSMIAQRPLQGYGLNTFLPMSEGFSMVGMNGAHNAYLQTLFETGIMGLLSFIVLFITPLIIFFKRMVKSVHPIQSKLWAIVVGYVVSYMFINFGDNLSYYLVLNWYVWFFIALMMVAERFSYD